MTVYTGRTFQTCALRVWGIWISMRDFHAATVRSNRAFPPGLNDVLPGLLDKINSTLDILSELGLVFAEPTNRKRQKLVGLFPMPRPSLVLSSRKNPSLGAKVVRRERHGYQELRGVHEDIRSFRASTKSTAFFRPKEVATAGRELRAFSEPRQAGVPSMRLSSAGTRASKTVAYAGVAAGATHRDPTCLAPRTDRRTFLVGACPCCYSINSMATKNAKLEKAVEKVAEIIQSQLDTLPPAVAKAKRQELHRLATKVSRSSGRGKPSRQSRNGDPRPLSRSRAKTA